MPQLLPTGIKLEDQYGEIKNFPKSFENSRFLVLYFYPKDLTPGCTTQAMDFERLRNDFEKLDAQIVGVSRDKKETHQKFCNKKDLGFTLLSDPDDKILKPFNVIKPKSMFGRTFLGIVRSTFLIDLKNQKVIKEWRKVKVAQHAQEVLMEIKTYLSNQSH